MKPDGRLIRRGAAVVTMLLLTAASPTVEQRLQRLEDRAAIENLILGDYPKAIDTANIGALSALFTQDGEYSSEWTDIAAMPKPLGALFKQSDVPLVDRADRFRVTFRGRKTIANFMALVVTARPAITVENRIAVATFDGSSAPTAGMTHPVEPDAGTHGSTAPAPPAPPGPPALSTKHLVTNPDVDVERDRAVATSYWSEVSVGQDRRRSIAGGGYYSDVLQRVGDTWKIRQRVIHNYDLASPQQEPASGASLPPTH